MTGPGLYQSLRDIKLNTVRRAISSECYRRSSLQTFGWFAFDLALYLGALWGVSVARAADLDRRETSIKNLQRATKTAQDRMEDIVRLLPGGQAGGSDPGSSSSSPT